MTNCRLLLDAPAPGAWNMAVDELFLDWSAEHGGCCWRFYGWHEPTLSLGYFQPSEDRQRHAASQACPVVRRPTGGGAIVHDAELTYSLVLPASHPLARSRDLMYETIHGGLIEAVADLGVESCLWRRDRGGEPTPEAFLCFQRRAPGDVVVGSTKIAGSAQRRRRGAVLQHGSVLLRRSAAAPELPGLADITGKTVISEVLGEIWLAKLARRLAVRWQPEPLSRTESGQAALLADGRYASAAWTTGIRASKGPLCQETL